MPGHRCFLAWFGTCATHPSDVGTLGRPATVRLADNGARRRVTGFGEEICNTCDCPDLDVGARAVLYAAHASSFRPAIRCVTVAESATLH
jgi:hypothetical protein